MKFKKIVSIFAVILMSSNMLNSYSASAITNSSDINVNIDTELGRKEISKYIYGTNYDSNHNQGDIDKVATSSRFGGNRFTGYNWENNASNAGNDYLHQSDNYLNMNDDYSVQNQPGQVVSKFQDEVLANDTNYSIATIQMAGYVAKDKDGVVSEAETAPSKRWIEVANRKGSEYSLKPDVNDEKVYMDEFINFLINKYGDSKSSTGIKGYSLDNEPALWASNHIRIHPNPVTCSELIDRSIDTASMIKDMDNNAEVFGPSLYGMTSFKSLNDAKDWSSVKGNYSWFVDYYLDNMKKASEEASKRLLDVFDIHYYPEATGNGIRVTEDKVGSDVECNKARMQCTRTLWDSSYEEDSWIGKWCKDSLPLIPKLKSSIEKYYPGTKLGITEYNFGGGGHISGGIAQADALGIFGRYGVDYANLWGFTDDTNYTQAAFNIYRNYDGNNSKYGDIDVSCNTSDIENSSVYASLDSKDSSKLHIILMNKNYDSAMKFNFNINSKTTYKSGDIYSFDENSSEVTKVGTIDNIQNNNIVYEVPKLTVMHIVLDSDESINNDYKDGFVKCDGSKFTLDGNSFYYAGTNNYYLPYATAEMVDDVFKNAEAMGLKVMRTWGFNDGDNNTDHALQPSLGVYDEEGFKLFDYMIEQAKKYDIKLIIPLVNNWDDFGGMKQYVEWVGASSHDEFYTNEKCKEAYKNYVNYFLNRTNTYSGIKYKDDPTIMCIELGNEPRCKSDPTGDTLYNWAKEMSEYIKSIDSNHLVAVGDEGFYNLKDNSDWNYCGGEGVDFERLISLDSIDFGTYHLYPDGWQRSVDWGTQWIKDHINSGKKANKPVILEEYGIKSNTDEVYKTWGETVIENDGAGLMFWILCGVGWDGNLYPNYDGFRVTYPSSTATVLEDIAEKMNNKNSSIADDIILGDVNNDKKISIFDCAMLQKYIVDNSINIKKEASDINKDGEINIKDLLMLKIKLVM